MLKVFKKQTIFFLLVLIALNILFPASALAQEGQGPCAGSENLAKCIVNIYRWALGVAVLLALTMIIFAGYLYMTAGGDAQRVASAKEKFMGAFIGIIILFAAVLILRTINPDLVLLPEDPIPLPPP